jgi:hypothetical protein
MLMKKFAIAVSIGLGVVMVAMNPNSDRYADYAVAQIKDSQNSICPDDVPILGTSIEKECKSLINNNSDGIKQVILQTTEQQNLLLFSIYKTDLSVNKLVPNLPSFVGPGYRFETIGVFGHFVTYQAESRQS